MMCMTDEEMHSIIEEMDPDWKDHFPDVTIAWDFYKDTPELLEAKKSLLL